MNGKRRWVILIEEVINCNARREINIGASKQMKTVPEQIYFSLNVMKT